MKRRTFLRTAGCAAASLATQACSTTSREFTSTPPHEKPNVLMIVADDMNYDAVKWLGGQLDTLTPNIDRLADNGMRFSNMFNTHARCAPSRGSMLTGLYQDAYCSEPGTWHVDLKPGLRPLPAILKEEMGYTTGVLGKETHYLPKEAYQWDVYVPMVDLGIGRHPELYYERALEFMNKAKHEGKPFFLAANSHDPHRPFAGAENEIGFLQDRYRKDIRRRKNPPPFIEPMRVRKYSPSDAYFPGFLPDLPEVRQEIANYFNSTFRFDLCLGRILDALEESGQQDNTLVIFLSDNGMHFPFAKSNCYLSSVKTPMVVSWKGRITPGTITDSLVSAVDLTPTILDAVNCPYRPDVNGKSFLPLCDDPTATIRDHVFCSMNGRRRQNEYLDFTMRAVITDRYSYIYNKWADGKNQFYNGNYPGGETLRAMRVVAEHDPEMKRRLDFFFLRTQEEFYDYSNDPDALNNLVSNEKYVDKVREYRHLLLDILRSNDDPFAGDLARLGP